MLSEKAIENKFKKEIEKIGGRCEKLSAAYQSGLPDRLVLLPGGLVFFVELKREGGRISPLQKVKRDMVIRLGHNYLLLEGENGLRECLDIIKHMLCSRREVLPNEV